jgi:hypothetical protein
MRSAIPVEVHRECCGPKKTLDALVIQKVVGDSRIQVVAARNRELVIRLQEDFSLGVGESEAIALVIQTKAQLFGVDDKNGINNARKLLGLSFTTAAGILMLCRERSLIGQSEALPQTRPPCKIRPIQELDRRGHKKTPGGMSVTKTMSIRMDRDNYEFLSELTREEHTDLFKTVRELVARGRVLLAIEKDRNGEASLGRAGRTCRPAARTDDDHPNGFWRREPHGKRGLSPRPTESEEDPVSSPASLAVTPKLL